MLIRLLSILHEITRDHQWKSCIIIKLIKDRTKVKGTLRVLIFILWKWDHLYETRYDMNKKEYEQEKMAEEVKYYSEIKGIELRKTL